MHPRLVLSAILALTFLSGVIHDVSRSSASNERRSGGHHLQNAVTAYQPDDEECAFVALINQFRADAGKDPLVLLQSLGAAAEHKSTDMAERDYFGHTQPPRTPGGPSVSFSQNISDFGYESSGRGENIAAGYESAQATFNQWERSTPHRRNMLGEDIDFKALGIGRAYDADSEYGWYWTTTFGDKVIGEVAVCDYPGKTKND